MLSSIDKKKGKNETFLGEKFRKLSGNKTFFFTFCDKKNQAIYFLFSKLVKFQKEAG